MCLHRYPYITFVYNICYAIALFWLLLLYVGTDELLKVNPIKNGPQSILCSIYIIQQHDSLLGENYSAQPYKPLLKFACFKAVIFLTFWQSLMIAFIAPQFKIDPDNAEALQNWIIVFEMLVASIGMLFAFPWSEYQIGGTAKGFSWESFSHAVSIMDVISDILHQVRVILADAHGILMSETCIRDIHCASHTSSSTLRTGHTCCMMMEARQRMSR